MRPRFLIPVLLAMSSAFAAAPAMAAKSASVEMRVGARIVPALRLRSAALPAFVEARASGDGLVASSRVDATVEVFSNEGGFALRFEIIDPAVAEIEVDGLGATVSLSGAGTTIPVRMSPEERNVGRRLLTYRILYRHGTGAGPRPFPLRVFLQNTT